MKLLSLLYVSRSTLSPEAAPAEVKALVDGSRARNPGLGITGALLFTGEYFAQVLEGAPDVVERLMGRVMRDPRHTDILVVARDPIAQRRFGRWSMAYCGPSQFVARYVTRLIADPGQPGQSRSARWLNDLLWEFAEGAGAS